MADTYDFTLENGATFSLSVTWKDSEGNPVDLTGYTARMQIRRTVNTPTYQIELTTENGRIAIATPANGTLSLTIAAADTEDILQGVYDLEVESAGGVVTRLIEGKVSVSKNVTR